MDYKNVNDYEIIYMVRENDEQYHDLLLEKYKPVINSMASKYLPYVKKQGLEFDDLVQEGYLGLEKAIQTFSEVNNTLFYTYACFCINRRLQTVRRNVSSNKNLVLSNSDFENEIYIAKDCSSEPLSVSLGEDLLNRVVNIVDSFGSVDSSIFKLKMNGFSYEEISVLLEIPIRKLQTRLYLIRKKILLQLEEN